MERPGAAGKTFSETSRLRPNATFRVVRSGVRFAATTAVHQRFRMRTLTRLPPGLWRISQWQEAHAPLLDLNVPGRRNEYADLTAR